MKTNLVKWQQVFIELREKHVQQADVVERARYEHAAAMQSGNVDRVIRANSVLEVQQDRLTIMGDLLEAHRNKRDAASAADHKAALAKLVAAHEEVRAEGPPALERVNKAINEFSREVDIFVATVTRIQNSARECGQLPAIRMTLADQEKLNEIHRIKDSLLIAAMSAASIWG